jgi:HSP20 family protein
MMTMWSTDPALDRVFDEALRSALKGAAHEPTFQAATDISERDDEYRFELDVPGVKRDDVEIALEHHMLTIRGERRFQRSENEKVTCGRPQGSFAVSYVLPDGIDGDQLTADLADGVLTVRVPKPPKAQRRKIPIAGSPEQKHLGG